MFSNQSAEISLNGSCRAMDAIWGDKIDNRFIVGTTMLHSSSSQQTGGSNLAMPKNKLLVVQFQTESNELHVETEFDHFTGAVSAICSHPSDTALVLTTTEQNCGATLWKMPPKDDYRHNSDSEMEIGNDNFLNNSRNIKQSNGNEAPSMERVASLQRQDADINSFTTCVAWRESEDSSGDVLTIDSDGVLSQWDVSFGTADAVKTVSVNHHPGEYYSPPPKVMWDPHSNSGDALAASFGADVHILDWRLDNSIPSGTVDVLRNCHRHGVTDIHYNPNKPYVLATGGKDGLLKFWDLRSTKQFPLLTVRGGHSHWIWNVRYNPFHDQLVLSTGTDSVVNLWRLSTISSSPLLTYDDEDDDFTGNNGTGKDTGASSGRSEVSTPNARVGRYEHSDSVYAASWGAADAWIYMTVGYDGKAMLNHVPSKEKYKILL